MRKTGYLIWLLLIVIQIALYYFLFRNLVESAYQNDAPLWFNRFVDTIYPRFQVEKYRFDLQFFLQKADQVIWRFCGVQALLLAGMYKYRFSPEVRRRFIDFWQVEVSVLQVRILSMLFYSGMIFFTYEWYDYLSELSKANIFYTKNMMLSITVYLI